MGGAANTSPGQAASSMPLPTTITCAGSWPDPEPWITDTLSSRGASARMMRLYSGTYLSVSGVARARPCSSSGTKSCGSLTNFFTATSVGYDWAGGSGFRRADRQGVRRQAGDGGKHDGDGYRAGVQGADAALAGVAGPAPLGHHGAGG